MKTIRNFCVLFVILIIGAFLVINFAIVTIPVGHVGVQIKNFAVLGPKGVVQEDFKPGWQWRIPGLHIWNKFDSTVQTLEMTRDPYSGSQRGRDDIRVKSADGYEVSIDVTMKFRIMEGKAHLVRKNTGIDGRYKLIVRDKAQKACQTILGQMKTEHFYNPDARRESSKKVMEVLQASLAENFVEVVDILLKAVQFDPQYEQKIQAKKLADQEVLLNVSLEKAEKMRGFTRKIEKETEMKVIVINSELEAAKVAIQNEMKIEVAEINAEADRISTELHADADLYQAEKAATGQLLIKKAEAQGEKLRNQAMQGVGGSTIVALEAARNLNIEDVTVSSMNVDFLNIDEMATKLGANK